MKLQKVEQTLKKTEQGIQRQVRETWIKGHQMKQGVSEQER